MSGNCGPIGVNAPCPATYSANDSPVIEASHSLLKFRDFFSFLVSSRMVKSKKIKWSNSDARFLLREDIIAGAVPETMGARIVYQMRPEYAEFEYNKFRSNLSNLRQSVAFSHERMIADCEAYGHDRGILNVLRNSEDGDEGCIQWLGSDAKRLLKRDIDEGNHLPLKPSELYATRVEYQAFELKVFRKHLYQELDTRTKRAARFAKKKHRHRAPA